MVCEDDEVFEDFKNSLVAMMDSLSNESFLGRCGLIADAFRPFKFSQTRNAEYMKSYAAIHRRACVQVQCDMFNFYAKQGLLDPEHTMGTSPNFQKYKIII